MCCFLALKMLQWRRKTDLALESAQHRHSRPRGRALWTRRPHPDKESCRRPHTVAAHQQHRWLIDKLRAGQSMSITLESFCNLFKIRSPCLMAAWYCAFCASGLRTQHDGVSETTRRGRHALAIAQPPSSALLCHRTEAESDADVASMFLDSLTGLQSLLQARAHQHEAPKAGTCWFLPRPPPCQFWRAGDRQR